MKRSQALALATALALPAAFAGAASASGSKLVAHAAEPHVRLLALGREGDDGGALPGGAVAHGSIGISSPTANAAGSLRALGRDDSSGSDGGGAFSGGAVAHGSIGNAAPSPSAVTQLRSLGGGDGGGDS